MGRHRSATSSRGISRGLILTVAALVVVVAVVVAWLALRGATDDEGARASGTCVSGDLTLEVAAAPAIAPSVRDLAGAYSDRSPVVRDHCITIDVREVDTAGAVATISGSGGPDAADRDGARHRPAVWIPDASTAVATLRAAAPDAVDGAPVSIAASPIVLAATADTAEQVGAPGWADLPGLQAAGDLGLAMPGGGGSAAAELTLAAVIADSGDDPTGAALTAADVASPAAQSAIARMMGRAPGDRAASPADVLAALRAGSADEGVRMVPATAQQVYAANGRSDGTDLAAVRPAGATPVADFPAVLLRPDGSDAAHAVSAAASDFINFISAADQQKALAQHGFLVQGAAPQPADPSGVLAGHPPATILPGPAPDAVAALSSAVAQPPTSGTSSTTVLLDVSGSMSAREGGVVRLDNVAQELDERIGRLPDADSVGLWTYSSDTAGGSTYRIIVPTGPLADDVGNGTARRDAIAIGLDSAAPLGATHTYRAVQAAYASAVKGYTDGGPNSVLLVTDGPNDDQSFTDTSRLLDAIARESDPTRPVAINVIMIGPNPDADSLKAMADRTGGTAVQVPSSVGDEFTGAVRDLLG